MKQEKINEKQGRKAYVPARVKVMEFTSQRVICISGGTEDGPGKNPDGWVI